MKTVIMYLYFILHILRENVLFVHLVIFNPTFIKLNES